MTPEQQAQIEALRQQPGPVMQPKRMQIGGTPVGVRAPVENLTVLDQAKAMGRGGNGGGAISSAQSGGGASGSTGPTAEERRQAYIAALRASSTPFNNAQNYPDDELLQLPGSPDFEPFDPGAPGVKPREEVTVGENEIVHGPLPPGYQYTKPPVYQEGDKGTYTGTGSYNGQNVKKTCGPNQYLAQTMVGPVCLSKKNYT